VALTGRFEKIRSRTLSPRVEVPDSRQSVSLWVSSYFISLIAPAVMDCDSVSGCQKG
jgi:hypothetical protein